MVLQRAGGHGEMMKDERWDENDMNEKDENDDDMAVCVRVLVYPFCVYRREVLLSPLLPEDWLAAVELDRLMSPAALAR